MKHSLSFDDLDNVCYKVVILSLDKRENEKKEKKTKKKKGESTLRENNTVSNSV